MHSRYLFAPQRFSAIAQCYGDRAAESVRVQPWNGAHLVGRDSQPIHIGRGVGCVTSAALATAEDELR